MLILLSPAKKLSLDFEQQGFTNLRQFSPVFERKTAALVERMKRFDTQGLMKLMKVSEKVATLNVERYRGFDEAVAQTALYMFRGDTYVGFDADSLNASDFFFADEHVRILSGLYGVLRAGDVIKPYRLEMATKFGRGDNLHTYWCDDATRYLEEELERQGSDVIVNLASAEYAKVLDVEGLRSRGIRFIDFVFKDSVPTGMKVVGLLAKKARGLYARAMVDARMEKVGSLASLQRKAVGGYKFSREESGDDRWVFTRGNGR